MNNKNYPDATLAKNLKRLCAERNIKQAELARICDKERKTANAWVNCVSSPTAWDIKQICMRYNLSADELLGLRKNEWEN